MRILRNNILTSVALIMTVGLWIIFIITIVIRKKQEQDLPYITTSIYAIGNEKIGAIIYDKETKEIFFIDQNGKITRMKDEKQSLITSK